MPPPSTPSRQSDADPLDELTAALKPVLRAGLPLRPGVAPQPLLDLDGVIARSVRSDDPLARIDALDRLLRATLKLLQPAERAEAAELLFVVARGGKTLTIRRIAAAIALDYEVHHFRKRIEPVILRDVAWQLHRDSLQYISRPRDGALFDASGSTPVITAEHITHPDTAEREILLSRIWSDVYGLRAELIAREATCGDPEKERQHQETATGALWYLARLLSKLSAYSEEYGKAILHGTAEYNAEALIRLAGWTGEVTSSQARELRFVLARVGEWDREAFFGKIARETGTLPLERL
jgi:hypothetical protein